MFFLILIGFLYIIYFENFEKWLTPFFSQAPFDKPNIPIDISNVHEWDSVLDESERLKWGESLAWNIKFQKQHWYKIALREA